MAQRRIEKNRAEARFFLGRAARHAAVPHATIVLRLRVTAKL